MKKIIGLTFLWLLISLNTFASIPTVAPSNPVFSNVTPISMRLAWTNGNGNRRLVIASSNVEPNTIPNLSHYSLTPNAAFGDGPAIGNGYIVYNNSGSFLDISKLWNGADGSTVIYFHVYEYNLISGVYHINTSNPTSLRLSANKAPLPWTPNIAPTNPVFTNVNYQSLTLGWTPGNGTRKLVIASKDNAPSTLPDYDDFGKFSSSTFGSGTAIGNGFIVYNGIANSVNITNLSPSSQYYFHIYEFNIIYTEYSYDTDLRLATNTSTTALAAPTVISSGAVTVYNDINLGPSLSASFTTVGNGDGRIVLARLSSDPVQIPSNNTIYHQYNASTTPALNWKVGNNFIINVLSGGSRGFNHTYATPGENYCFDVFEFNGNLTGGTAVFNTTPYTICIKTPMASVPTLGPSNPVFTNITTNSLKLSWTNGNGNRRMVVARKDSLPRAINTTNFFEETYDRDYNANANYGSGSALGAGFVVYQGTGNEVTVNNLELNGTYYFHIYEMNEFYHELTTTYYNVNNRVNTNRLVASASAPTLAPSGPASATVTDLDSMTVNFTGSFTNKGNGAGRLLLMRPCSGIPSIPSNNVIKQKYTYAQHDAIFGSSRDTSYWVNNYGLVLDFGDIQSFNFTFRRMPGLQLAFDVFEYNGNLAAGTAVFNTTPLTFCANAISSSTPTAPTTGATSLSFSAVGQSSLTLGWTNGNGTSRLVIARKSAEISSTPTNNTSYSANPVFGNGTALGGGFVVYNGSGSSVNVTGLDPASTYYFSVIEYLTGTETITYASSLRTTSSTNTTSSSSSSDSDEDGVPDADDEFPTDPFMALSTSYPAAGFGTLMFEDLWPGKGDYDFNDLVLDYRYTVISNGDGNVVEARYTFVTRAIGGGLQNGFAFQLDGIPASRIHSVSGAKTNGISYASIGANGVESNQTNANILVLKNASELLARSSGFAYMNVEAEAPKVEADTTVVIVKLLHEGVSPVETFTAIADFSPTIFNPYLIVGQERGKEVHLANRVPSALANVTYFGREDDNSSPLQGRYYKTSNELPWALNIVQSVPHVIEKVDFTEAYLKFVDWAISGGVNHADWYLDLPGNRNTAKIYSK